MTLMSPAQRRLPCSHSFRLGACCRHQYRPASQYHLPLRGYRRIPPVSFTSRYHQFSLFLAHSLQPLPLPFQLHPARRLYHLGHRLLFRRSLPLSAQRPGMALYLQWWLLRYLQAVFDKLPQHHLQLPLRARQLVYLDRHRPQVSL